jgi:ABC-type amino acid transport substrate-binding protein
VELRIVPQDVSELIPAVWFGRADLALGWLAEDVGDYVDVSEPYASSAHVVIVRRR